MEDVVEDCLDVAAGALWRVLVTRVEEGVVTLVCPVVEGLSLFTAGVEEPVSLGDVFRMDVPSPEVVVVASRFPTDWIIGEVSPVPAELPMPSAAFGPIVLPGRPIRWISGSTETKGVADPLMPSSTR